MDFAIRQQGHRTWRWSARCGHTGTAPTRTAAAGAAWRHIHSCASLPAAR